MVYLLREGIKRREVIFSSVFVFFFTSYFSLASILDRSCGSGWLPLVGFVCFEDMGCASCPQQKVFALQQVQVQRCQCHVAVLTV